MSSSSEGMFSTRHPGAAGGRLDGKVALVTGGTRGIGRACVEAFLAEGALVAFSGSSEETVWKASSEIISQDRKGFIADLSIASEPERLVSAVTKQFGRIDILVNNAGISGPSHDYEVTHEEWDRMQAINLRAPYFLAQHAAISMQGRRGSIVNISSIAGQNGGIAGNPAYAASKAGLIGLTRSLARRFAALGIRVNCIAPADIETDMTSKWSTGLRKKLLALTPLGRFGAAHEVAAAAVFLSSNESSYITGQTLSVNGGALMG